MTTEEFSNEFDTLVDAYSQTLPFGTSQDPPYFNEYEKSVFLTKAQEQIVLMYYSTSMGGDSFETTEEVRRYLDQLVKTEILINTSDVPKSIYDSFKHSIYQLPSDLWFIVYEQVKYAGNENNCINGFVAEIIPITHDSYYRTIQNPFRGPSRKRVLRLDSGFNTVELVSKYDIERYQLRYLAKPNPIILTDLKDLTIEGKNTRQECLLTQSLHRKILELGVQLALQSRIKENKEDKKQ